MKGRIGRLRTSEDGQDHSDADSLEEGGEYQQDDPNEQTPPNHRVEITNEVDEFVQLGRLNERKWLVVPANAVVFESYHVHLLGGQTITAIEYESGRSHAAGDFTPVGVDYLLPFGEQDQGMSPGRSLYWIVQNQGGGWEFAGGGMGCSGVEGLHFHAFVNQRANEIERGGVADVVGLGLECESEDSDLESRDRASKSGSEGIQGQQTLLVVHVDNGSEEFEVHAAGEREIVERTHVFRKARAAVANSGVDSAPGSGVHCKALAHGVNRGANPVAKGSYFVDEGEWRERRYWRT